MLRPKALRDSKEADAMSGMMSGWGTSGWAMGAWIIVWVVLGLAVVAGGVMIARALGPKP
jgi:hypothetical protein